MVEKTRNIESPVLTIAQMAEYLKCSVPTATEVANRADFNGLIRVGATNRRKIILKSALDEWLILQATK